MLALTARFFPPTNICTPVSWVAFYFFCFCLYWCRPVLPKSRATKSFTVTQLYCGYYLAYKILYGFTCYVEVNFSGHSRDTCVCLQHAACFKSHFGARNLDVAHIFWKGGVDLQVSEARWRYFALSLVSSSDTWNALLTLATTHLALRVVLIFVLA
jgi:hypothetical protein